MVRIALAEKGLPFELLTEVPWDCTTAMPCHNRLEKLPVLILEYGSSVYESSFTWKPSTRRCRCCPMSV
ncbi:MAG: hypothetical protein NVS3B2_18830 [Ramlibacter sp.]